MLDKLKGLLAHLKGEMTESELNTALTRIVNCRLLGWVVKYTGTEVDDKVLTALKTLFPKK